MKSLGYPDQKEETVDKIRKESRMRESRRITTLRVLTNDSKSWGARTQGGWTAMMSDGGYEAKSSSSMLV